MRYLIRDHEIFDSLPDDLSNHDIRLLVRVRADARDPHETADAVHQQSADSDTAIYLQHAYEDPDGIPMSDDEARMAYWTGWFSEFCSQLRGLGASTPIAIEHPYSWDDRRSYEALRFFATTCNMVSAATDVNVVQFGVGRVSPNVYQVPMSSDLSGRTSDDPTLRGLWVNLPGQHAFGDNTTTYAEFCLGLAWAKAHKVRDVVLWSNPARTPTPAVLESVWDAIRLIDPPPVKGGLDLTELTLRPGEAWGDFMRRLNQRGGSP